MYCLWEFFEMLPPAGLYAEMLFPLFYVVTSVTQTNFPDVTSQCMNAKVFLNILVG